MAQSKGTTANQNSTTGTTANPSSKSTTDKIKESASSAAETVTESAKSAGNSIAEGARKAVDYAKENPGTTAAVVGGVAAAAAAVVGTKMYKDAKLKEEARERLDEVGFPEMRDGKPGPIRED